MPEPNKPTSPELTYFEQAISVFNFEDTETRIQVIAPFAAIAALGTFAAVNTTVSELVFPEGDQYDAISSQIETIQTRRSDLLASSKLLEEEGMADAADQASAKAETYVALVEQLDANLPESYSPRMDNYVSRGTGIIASAVVGIGIYRSVIKKANSIKAKRGKSA